MEWVHGVYRCGKFSMPVGVLNFFSFYWSRKACSTFFFPFKSIFKQQPIWVESLNNFVKAYGPPFHSKKNPIKNAYRTWHAFLLYPSHLLLGYPLIHTKPPTGFHNCSLNTRQPPVSGSFLWHCLGLETSLPQISTWSCLFCEPLLKPLQLLLTTLFNLEWYL